MSFGNRTSPTQPARADDHFCWLYETEEDHRAVVPPFLRQGLERGAKMLYVVDAHTADEILGYLHDDGLQTAPYLEAGQLCILSAGAFVQSGPIAWLRAEIEQSLDVLTTRPFAIVGTKAYDSLYSIPPRQFLVEDRAAAKLSPWLTNLAGHKRTQA
jgi:hypothetical protein